MNNTYLGFKPGEDASYTLTFTHTANTNDRYTKGIYLVDLVTDKVTDISQSGSQYAFTATSSDPEKRFKIVTSNVPGFNIPTSLPTITDKSEIAVFNNDKIIFVTNHSSSSGQLSVYDITGRLVEQVSFKAMEEKAIHTQLPVGIYIAKATTNTLEVTKRLIIRK
jgi:hypothetical protein